MTSPRHADKDCLTTEENVTIFSSRTRALSMRSSVALGNQQKGGVIEEPLETRE